ncbi:hypothetical protein A3K82_00140 [Candidatus Pacearchaeota archaeon RBG_19FT_COMBO_34_9]|nr:MAG: hypothetical protein A3K82_00140 [Candidatus Pacearchaeota archaeon RBG_19FT_COMBO_34_9]OGJ17323.1 MAG: hypothetical protein A3K74_01700 [Candidatus Pacearchaeota archaeon RBG_13_33_26]
MQSAVKSNVKRVLTNKKGNAVTTERARQLGIKTDVVFIRNDGYHLGAPEKLREKARSMFREDWAKFYDTHERIKRPISDYRSYFSGKRN